jgi:hypothetical protein
MRALSLFVLLILVASFGCSKGAPLEPGEKKAEIASEKTSDASTPEVTPEKACKSNFQLIAGTCQCRLEEGLKLIDGACYKTCVNSTTCSKGTTCIMHGSQGICAENQCDNQPVSCTAGHRCNPFDRKCVPGCETTDTCPAGKTCVDGQCRSPD